MEVEVDVDGWSELGSKPGLDSILDEPWCKVILSLSFYSCLSLRSVG